MDSSNMQILRDVCKFQRPPVRIPGPLTARSEPWSKRVGRLDRYQVGIGSDTIPVPFPGKSPIQSDVRVETMS